MLDALAAAAGTAAQGAGGMPSAMGQPGQPGQPGQGSGNVGAGVQQAVLSKAELKRMGVSTMDWALLRGELENEILQAASESGPKEYREDIKRYFQIIAKKGAEKEDRQDK